MRDLPFTMTRFLCTLNIQLQLILAPIANFPLLGEYLPIATME